MATERQKYATKVLANIADDERIDPAVRIQAAQTLDDTDYSFQYMPRWYEVSVKDLAVFALKCVVAFTPAALLGVVMWIFFIIFNGVAAQVLGGL